VHPLDDGTLSSVGNTLTGERARGGATAFSSRPLWAVNSLVLSVFGAREEGEEEKAQRRGKDTGGPGPGGAHPRRRRRTPAAGTLAPPQAAGVGEGQGRRKKCLGFSRVTGRTGLLFHRKLRMAVGSCPMQMDG
jgi:hypothetical protein